MEAANILKEVFTISCTRVIAAPVKVRANRTCKTVIVSGKARSDEATSYFYIHSMIDDVKLYHDEKLNFILPEK